MSYGMGVDSTAILLRWLADPSSRDFDLGELIVITAHTGDEFNQTLRDVEEVVLPELRRHGVQFIQVGRTQRKTTASGEGVAVLDDSTAPQRLHVDGYKLSRRNALSRNASSARGRSHVLGSRQGQLPRSGHRHGDRRASVSTRAGLRGR
jgi:hypothetical protein